MALANGHFAKEIKLGEAQPGNGDHSPVLLQLHSLLVVFNPVIPASDVTHKLVLRRIVQPALDVVDVVLHNTHPASQPTSQMAASVVTIPWLQPSKMSAGGEQGGGGEGREEDEEKDDQEVGRISWKRENPTRIHLVHGREKEKGGVRVESGWRFTRNLI